MARCSTWGSLADACAGAAPDSARLPNVWQAKQLEYSFLRALTGSAAYVDFWQVTSDALDFALEQLGLTLSSRERVHTLDPDLVEACLAVVEPQADQFQASRAFGTRVDVPAGADALTRLLRLLGRRPPHR